MSAPATLMECISASQATARILLVAPSPLNDPRRVSADPEIGEVFSALDELRADVDIIRLNPPTISNLRIALTTQRFDVVHISCHSGHGNLEFEDSDGTVVPVPFEEFAGLFPDAGVSVLVLNGCSTEELSDRMSVDCPQLTTYSMAGELPKAVAHATVKNLYSSLFAGASPRHVLDGVIHDLTRRQSSSSPRIENFLQLRGPDSNVAIFRNLPKGNHRPKYYDCHPRSNVPAIRKPLFDRESETLRIHSMLFGDDLDTPFAGMIGITGAGKTVLAHAFATRFGWRFPDGVAYFSLSTSFSSDMVATFFDWNVSDLPPEAVTAEVARRLSENRTLLIFDELDAASSPGISELVKLLMSWDTRLGGRALLIFQSYKHEFQQILGANWVQISRLPVDAACDLLINCLGGAQRARLSLGDDAPEAAELCFGHPRTIESTAALLRLGQSWINLRGDLERLSTEGPLGTNSEMLSRVIARLEAQYPVIANLLDALAVFSHSCRESMWRTVAESAFHDPESLHRFITDALIQLDFARLVERQDVAGETHCSMHPLVVAHLRTRHRGLSATKKAAYASKHLEEQAALLATRGDFPVEESANIQRALDVASELSLWSAIVRYATAAVGSVNHVLVQRGPWPLAQDLLRHGTLAARQSLNAAVTAQFLLVEGMVRYRLAEFEDASASYDEALRFAQEAEDPGLQVKALRGSGQLTYRAGDFTAAAAFYEQAKAMAESMSAADKSDIAHQLAKIRYRERRFTEAESLLQSVRTTRAAISDHRGLAKTIHELARVEHAQEHYAAGRDLYEEALAIERRLTDPVMEQATLFQLGRLLLEQNDLATAASYLQMSRQISENLGDRVWIAHGFFGDALISHANGDTESARLHAGKAIVQAQLLKIGLATEVQEWMDRCC